MRILFFTPYFNQPRGNATTARRIIESVRELGIEASVYAYLEDSGSSPDSNSFDVVHILHATRFARWATGHKFILDKPYVITLGGTDINLDMQENLDHSAALLLDSATYLTVFTQDAKSKIQDLQPSWAVKTHLIPQTVASASVKLADADYNIPHLLLPAGLRPVKDVLHPLPALDRLVGNFPGLTFTIIGAKLDEEVYSQVIAAGQTRPWLNYAGEVPFEKMLQWYEKSNIVLNTSISEGQSLALMEAMSYGRPVIARSNEANISLIEHGKTGWLYDNMNQFISNVTTIMTSPHLRHQVIKNAQNAMQQSPLDEAEVYVRLYSMALSKKR